MVKYDDAAWHYEGDFPANLSHEAGATHIGMFVAWCMLNGMAGDVHRDEPTSELNKLYMRELTPGQWFMHACDAKFTDEDVNDEGNAFAASYYALDKGQYLADYERTLGEDYPSLYHVPDNWHSYDRLAAVISQRYHDWTRLKT